MPIYQWEGKNRKGEIQKGEMEAVSVEGVRFNLSRLRITPVKIKAKPRDLLENIAFLQPQVKENDIIVFIRQFSTMIDAGLPILQCLDILQAQQENKTFKRILKKIKDTVEGGSTLAESMRKHPKEFNDLFVNMVAAGETGGVLDAILKRLAEYMEKMARLKRKVKGAMVYPGMTLAVAVIVVTVILVFVIPVFSQMFSEMGASLPGPTLFVISVSNFMKSNILYIIGGLIVFAFLFKRFYATPRGQLLIDGAMLKTPIFGVLLRKVAVAKFTRTLGTMLASGVSILEALGIVARTAGNKIVENSVYRVRSGIAEGRTMTDPLIETGVFPPMVCQMISVGETTGELDRMLIKIADFYDEEVDQAVENLTTMIEPLMLVFLGIIVGGLLVAMYLPIFTMAQHIA